MIAFFSILWNNISLKQTVCTLPRLGIHWAKERNAAEFTHHVMHHLHSKVIWQLCERLWYRSIAILGHLKFTLISDPFHPPQIQEGRASYQKNVPPSSNRRILPAELHWRGSGPLVLRNWSCITCSSTRIECVVM